MEGLRSNFACPFILYMRNQVWTIDNLHSSDIFALRIFLNIVWNIMTCFSNIETLWGEKFCTYPGQNACRILSPLDDTVFGSECPGYV